MNQTHSQQIIAGHITVQLRQATTFNGVLRDSLTLRAPLVRDIRNAQRLTSDETEREMQLFASLAEVSVAELEGMAWRDYRRLQEAYFRLAADDDTGAGPTAPIAATAG
ncbi:phage tail assembly protein [Chitinimonas arctica]|uniref:Phage tail assembly protein n=1 Tax=Chitinimonas arctica TaxID=2594795 RepID=A0A516SJJ3_9NEIS|nr:phage tail assembly protein [Chitinimonas arctica]QDQ28317.1 phage tail assembly protein [Chitinimonas arctica]